MREKAPSTFDRIQALFVCAALHFLAYLEFCRIHPIPDEIANWRVQFVILVSLSFLLSVKICLDYQAKSAYGLLLLQIFAILIMNYPERSNVTLACFIFGVPLYEAALMPVNPIWISLLVPAVSLVSAGVHPVPFWDDPAPEPLLEDYGLLLGSMVLHAFFACRLRSLGELVASRAESLERQRISIDNLLNANLDFQTYAAEIGEKSTIEERKRLTREVHDIVGYTLINIRMMMEAAIELTPAACDRLRDQLQRTRDQVMTGLTETRGALRNFRAIDVSVLEGPSRIQRFVKSFSQATGIEVSVNYGNIPRTLGPEIDSAVVRIIQESMTNAFRHGKATVIQIGLWIDDGRLLVKVSDNGVGAVDIKPGIGITGMGERLDPLNGTLIVRSTEHGFVVDATIPLRKDSHG